MAVPKDAGYPLQWFKQQEFVRKLYECAICLEVVRDPVQVRDCGHQFCRYCLDRVMKSQRRCPSCRIEISNEMIFSDIAAMRVTGKLDVNCPNNGCEWDGCLNSLLQEHTEACLFLKLPCSNVGCIEQVIRGEIPAHFMKCEYRTVVCQYCLNNYVFRDRFTHFGGCPSFPVPCTNKCLRKAIARNKMEEHLKTECVKTVVKCNYSEIGCNYKCQRQKLQEHLKQKMEDHLRLSSLEISKLKDKCDQYEKNIKELKQKADAVLFLLIIPDFNKKLHEAKDANSLGRIDSDPFYSSKYGYKMKLLADLNETRPDFKDHMAVYLIIMKSDNDVILSWPFEKKYTFTLIDQQDDENEKKNIVMSITPNGEKNFEKPQCDQNEGLGYGNFVSHGTLQTRSYVKDDTVMIKFSMNI